MSPLLPKWMLLSLLIGFAVGVDAQQRVRHLQPNLNYDPQNTYFVVLLAQALSASEEKYGPFTLEPIDLDIFQERQLRSLVKGELDVLWTVSTPQREKLALAVKFPLLDGLLGKRVLVIKASDKAQFEQIDSTDGLRKLIALQGHDWPDAQILSYNGFNVKTSSWYNRMYQLLVEGFVDFYPRGALEAGPELEQQKNPNLIIDAKHLLVYPTYIYFFVSKQNQTLAERLEYGLETLQKTGQFKQLLYENKRNKAMLEGLALDKRLVHQLKLPPGM